MIKDDDYELDPSGNRVLIGLTAEETAEFFRLDEIISKGVPLPPITDEAWHLPEQRRWLELYEKHEARRRLFLKGSKTMH